MLVCHHSIRRCSIRYYIMIIVLVKCRKTLLRLHAANYATPDAQKRSCSIGVYNNMVRTVAYLQEGRSRTFPGPKKKNKCFCSIQLSNKCANYTKYDVQQCRCDDGFAEKRDKKAIGTIMIKTIYEKTDYRLIGLYTVQAQSCMPVLYLYRYNKIYKLRWLLSGWQA